MTRLIRPRRLCNSSRKAPTCWKNGRASRGPFEYRSPSRFALTPGLPVRLHHGGRWQFPISHSGCNNNRDYNRDDRPLGECTMEGPFSIALVCAENLVRFDLMRESLNV